MVFQAKEVAIERKRKRAKKTIQREYDSSIYLLLVLLASAGDADPDAGDGGAPALAHYFYISKIHSHSQRDIVHFSVHKVA